MVMELQGTDTATMKVKEIIENDTLLSDTNNMARMSPAQIDEPIKISSVDSSLGQNGKPAEVKPFVNADLPKNATDEWTEPKIHNFYFIRFRSYNDATLQAKLDRANKEVQKRTEARQKIFASINAKRAERTEVIAQLKPLSSEEKNFKVIMDEKRKEMEPLHDAIGRIRNANKDAREKGMMGLCSSEEELDSLIESLDYRIQHESNTLAEEKKLLKEMKQLEGSREKVIAIAAMRSKLQESLVQKEAIEDQVKFMDIGLDGVRKEKKSVTEKIKYLVDQRKVIDTDLSVLQNELESATKEKDKAYAVLHELKKTREEANACYYQNRNLLINAKDLSVRKDIAALEELLHCEVEKFMLEWGTSKTFRDDYERRILSSLDGRQLSKDGRMRNPDEKPIVSEIFSKTEPEEIHSKVNGKVMKEETKPSPERRPVSSEKLVDDAVLSSKPQRKEKMARGFESDEALSDVATLNKEVPIPDKDDPLKLQEMKREEEIAKSKMAFERKRRLAEKAAAKADARAKKEAEKKLKEKEKKARKKAGQSKSVVSVPDDADVEADAAKDVEREEVDAETDVTAAVEKNEVQKAKIRPRNRPKQHPIHKVVLKRKKSHSYWLWWAGPAGVLAALLVMVGYYYSQKN